MLIRPAVGMGRMLTAYITAHRIRLYLLVGATERFGRFAADLVVHLWV
jgi:hypothetical protein